MDAGYVTRDELAGTEKRLSRDIKENRDRINEHTESIARLDTLYTSLEGLPGAISNLDKTLFQLGENMNSMKEQMNSQMDDVNNSIQSLRNADAKHEEEIEQIDSKSKIDWQSAITNNFWKILSACLGAWVVIQFIINNLGG